MLPRVALAAATVLLLVGCPEGDGPSPATPTRDAVSYAIGASTDPYGRSAPSGVGVVTGLRGGAPRKVEIEEHGLAGAFGPEWLDGSSLLVPRPAPPLRPPLIYRFDGNLTRRRASPIPSGAGYAWSPRARLFAYEPVVPCATGQRSLYACYRGSGKIFVVGRNAAGRRRIADGHLAGWTADGRVAFCCATPRAQLETFDLDSGARGVVEGWESELPVWSADGRYAAGASGTGVVVAGTGGRVVRTIRSKLLISMLAWAPVGERLAFTTSGFPDPHQLFVVDSPTAKPRLLYATGAVHFDWITWSPDGRWLLLDEEHKHRWLLLRTDRSGIRRSLSRLGGRPVWCCPSNPYSVGGQVRNSNPVS